MLNQWNTGGERCQGDSGADIEVDLRGAGTRLAVRAAAPDRSCLPVPVLTAGSTADDAPRDGKPVFVVVVVERIDADSTFAR